MFPFCGKKKTKMLKHYFIITPCDIIEHAKFLWWSQPDYLVRPAMVIYKAIHNSYFNNNLFPSLWTKYGSMITLQDGNSRSSFVSAK